MWWFLLKSILSAVLGSQFYKWYANTKLGVWTQKHINRFMEYISNKYNINLMKKELKFRRDYPLIMERLEKLENRQNPDLYGYNKTSAKFGRLDHEVEKDG